MRHTDTTLVSFSLIPAHYLLLVLILSLNSSSKYRKCNEKTSLMNVHVHVRQTLWLPHKIVSGAMSVWNPSYSNNNNNNNNVHAITKSTTDSPSLSLPPLTHCIGKRDSGSKSAQKKEMANVELSSWTMNRRIMNKKWYSVFYTDWQQTQWMGLWLY